MHYGRKNTTQPCAYLCSQYSCYKPDLVYSYSKHDGVVGVGVQDHSKIMKIISNIKKNGIFYSGSSETAPEIYLKKYLDFSGLVDVCICFLMRGENGEVVQDEVGRPVKINFLIESVCGKSNAPQFIFDTLGEMKEVMNNADLTGPERHMVKSIILNEREFSLLLKQIAKNLRNFLVDGWR